MMHRFGTNRPLASGVAVEPILAITLFIVLVAGILAFTGVIKAATVAARFVFYIALVVFVGVLIAYLVA